MKKFKKYNTFIPFFKSAFTRLVKVLRSDMDSPENHSVQSGSHSSHTKFRFAHLYGFTLAETLITVSIIGVIATISLSSLVHNNTEKTNRLKLRKAIDAYSNAIVMMTSQNYISPNTDALNTWAKKNNCANAREYFMAIENGKNAKNITTPCIFKTKDGIWWDIGVNGKMSKALVAFKEADLTKAKANSTNSNDAFYLTTLFDKNKKARIIDLQYANDIKSDYAKSNSKVMSFLDK